MFMIVMPSGGFRCTTVGSSSSSFGRWELTWKPRLIRSAISSGAFPPRATSIFAIGATVTTGDEPWACAAGVQKTTQKTTQKTRQKIEDLAAKNVADGRL